MNQILRNQEMVLNSLNQIMLSLVESLPNKPGLGPEFSSDAFEPFWLQAHRIKKSFFIPDQADQIKMHESAIRSMLMEDSKLTGFSYDNPNLRFVRRALYQSRLQLSEILSDFSLDLSDFDLSSGETFVSSGGRTSLFNKLKDKSQWVVTADAADYVTKIIYCNRGLKQAAMLHIRKSCSARMRSEYFNTTFPCKTFKTIGLAVFARLCHDHLFTYCYGSRCETVPKNNSVRRTINVEPWLNIIFQRVISHALRKCLKRHGNDLTDGQEVHKMMISDRKFATIDFSNASNSTALSSVKFMFPPKVFNLLEAARSPFVLAEGNFFPLNMLSAMGNGFTFEVMTLLLLSIGRTLDPNCRVYGDDVIISNRHARHFVECCDVVGYRVNATKTFISSSFRESCGAYYHDDYGYLTSFDFKPSNNPTIIQAIIWCNKLGILADANPFFSSAYKKALALFPPSMKGPWPPEDARLDNLPSYVWSRERKQPVARQFETLVPLMAELTDRFCVPFGDTKQYKIGELFYTIPRDCHVVKSVSLKPVLASHTVVNVKNPFKRIFYIYNGRRSHDVIRNEFEFKEVYYFVSSHFFGPVGSFV